MHRTLEAIIDEKGRVRLLEPLQLPYPARALVTVLEDDLSADTLLSEAALAEDWERAEEDEAWRHLEP